MCGEDKALGRQEENDDEDFSLTLKEGQVLILTDCKLKK